MIDLASQIWVTCTGLPALWMTLTHRPRLRRWATVVGLLGQPAWYVQLVVHEQWAMAPVFAGYTGAWLFGFWNHWIKRRTQ